VTQGAVDLGLTREAVWVGDGLSQGARTVIGHERGYDRRDHDRMISAPGDLTDGRHDAARCARAQDSMVTERRVSDDTRRAARVAHKMVALDLRPAYHVRYENVAQFRDDPFAWFIWVEELPGVWATASRPDAVEDAARAAIASALDVAPRTFDVRAEVRSKPDHRPLTSAHRGANSEENEDMSRVTVGPSAGGGWQVTGEDRIYPTQADAQETARRRLTMSGGGELVVKGRDGRVRMQNTIGRPDPRRSKG
jgi:hypothetical protein